MENVLEIYEHYLKNLTVGERLRLLTLLAADLSSQLPAAARQAKDLQAAEKRLRRYCGVFESGDADAGNNDRIDKDLAREYGC
jgi:hypothetical protein